MVENILKMSDELSSLVINLENKYELEVHWMRAMKLEDEWKIKMHRHSSVEVHIVKEGSSFVSLKNKEFEVSEGEVYITAPGIYHAQKNGQKKSYTEYSLNFSIKEIKSDDFEIKNMVEVLNKAKPYPFCDENKLIEKFEEALKEAYLKPFGYRNKIKNIVEAMVIDCARCIIKNEKIDKFEDRNETKRNYKFLEFKKYVNDNINMPLKASEIANHIHISERQLLRIVKKSEGVSVKEYISNIKYKKAEEHLKNDKKSISQIAEELGFSNAYYFSRFFKERSGWPPSVYRKNVGKG